MEQRIEMLRSLPYPAALSDGGLFLEIAREARSLYGPGIELDFLCGADAAERILTWDYGDPEEPENMLREFGLLVAPRAGEYHPPASLRSRVRALQMPPEARHISSTEVRNRIARGEAWETLVPETVREFVREIYS